MIRPPVVQDPHQKDDSCELAGSGLSSEARGGPLNVPNIAQGVRRIPPNGRSVTGFIMSGKGIGLPFESLRERDFVILADSVPEVIKIVPQPLRIGKHIPDYQIETKTNNYIVDSKYESELVRKWDRLAPVFFETAKYCAGNGLTYVFFTDAIAHDHRNRLSVLKQMWSRRLELPEIEDMILSVIRKVGSVSVRQLVEKIDTRVSVDVESAINSLILSGGLSLVDTPTQFITDAIVDEPNSCIANIASFTIPFARLAKRIETHPIRYLNDSCPMYHEGMKEIQLSGHKYEVLDSSCPENLLVRSVESGENYRVSLDTIPAPGDRLSLYALQEKNSERYYDVIRRKDIIAGLACLETISSDVLSRTAAQLGLSPRQVQRLVKNYRLYEASGLVPSFKKGGKGKHRLNDEIEHLVGEAIKGYMTTHKKSVKATYESLETAVNNLNMARSLDKRLKCPDERTLRNRINGQDQRSITESREGLHAAEERFGVFGGKFPEGQFPLQTVMMDHTLGDIELVSGGTREPVGRPHVTVILDTHSAMVCAYNIGMKPPDANTNGLTILMCAKRKDEYVEQYGMSEWPVHGIPGQLHFDNGKDLSARLIAAGCQAFNIQIMHRPVRNPRFGGLVERFFGTFERSFVHDLPGTTKSSPREKGEYDSEKEACLTPEEFERLFLKFVDRYHHTRQEELGMSPIEKWREGVQQYGEPRKLPVEREEEFRLSFLPIANRTIQKDGITFEGLTYYSDRLLGLSRRILGKEHRSVTYLIRYDPLDLRRIYVWDVKTNKYYRIPATTPISKPIVLHGMKKSRRELKEQGIAHPSVGLQLEQYKKDQAATIENAALLTKKQRRKAEQRKRELKTHARFDKSSTQSDHSHQDTHWDYEPPPKDRRPTIRIL